MRGRFAPYVVGVGLIGLGLVMLLFTFYALLARDPFAGFLVTAGLAGSSGLTLMALGTSKAEPTRRESLLSVLLLWLLVPFVGALPYVITGNFTLLNAFFESMSGFTTTGATVLRNFSAFPDSLFMWRALSQWFGGIGIIVVFIAVFPQLAIAGRQLFFAEAPGPTQEKLSPRLRQTAGAVLIVYAGLTLLCAVAYILAGMSAYDAIAHAFTTLAAGGFSPKGLSFEDFASPLIDWTAIFFMTFAGANFALLYRALNGRPRSLIYDAEFKTYLGLALSASLILSLLLLPVYEPLDALRHGLFQVLSILTTTGYASVDFANWPERAETVLLILMFIGGSAGSAAGGVKVARWLIISNNTAREVRRSLHTRAVMPVRVGDRIISEEVMRAVAAFLTLYIGLFAFSTAVLVMFGADFITAFTASIACIGNIGPGLGEVGPMANFADLHPVSRGLLIFGMYAGRLEVVSVFVILDPRWWRVPKGLWRSRDA